MNHIIGLDIGIGSIGWAVINLDKRRIEDCGVRIFETGEDKDRKSNCQNRRGARGIRRVLRRKSYRKSRLKKHFEIIGMTTESKINEYFSDGNSNIIALRVKAISEMVTPEELAACLINICNYRGYKDFYAIDSAYMEQLTKDERKILKADMEALNHIKELMEKGDYKTPAEMILNENEFNSGNGDIRQYHNSASSENINLISRDMLEQETRLILEKQSEYYDCLNEENINKTIDIIFRQRAFEEGPGDKNDPFRKYKGFLDSIGNCRFYQEEKRGSRFTAIADIYALVNTLSQYKYFDKNGEFCFNGELAQALISYALENGSMNKTEMKKITKKFGITINDSDISDNPLTKCFKYLKSVKPVFESSGYDWKELIKDYTDTENNLLNRVGITMSQYITPRIREKELRKLPIDENLVKRLTVLKLSGTANVSYKYMSDSINAFLEGDIYGRYQAAFLKENDIAIDEKSKPAKLPPFKSEDDCEFYKNPVVFRAINETRKVLNAITEKYGYPCAINIETADELNKSAANRLADTLNNQKNEKKNDEIKSIIAKKLEIPVESVRPVQIEKYKLWESQGEYCLYSDKKIDLIEMLKDNSGAFEIDHIVPYSLILDNTLNNKALVYREENQRKGQQTPLMYMNEEQAAKFKSKVNEMFKNKKCSKKKYQYLMLADLTNCSLLDEWKSRNLNDTRYIAKYLVNYLRDNMRFNPTREFEDGFKIAESRRVFAVKSKFTSHFRKLWLNPKTWGRRDKEELKAITYLDHAADAIVIANCRPEYVIIAGEKTKLFNIYKNAGRHITEEYKQSFNNCVDSLVKFYGIDRNFAINTLKDPSTRLTPIVPNILNETDNRLRDFNTHRILFDAPNDTDEQIIETFRSLNRINYNDDPEFAESLKMPVISYKPERSYAGEITTKQPISIKEIDGKMYELSRKEISKLTCKDLNKIHSDDTDLIDSLKNILDGKSEKYTVKSYLDEKQLPYFTTLKGRRINKVTLLGNPITMYHTKQISDNNYTVMDNRCYYCLEIYTTKDGKTSLCGIAMTDIVKKNKKLYLKPEYKYPEDYGKHVMYLFKGDYIRLYKKNGKIEFEGYYLSSDGINKNNVKVISDNSSKNPKNGGSKTKAIGSTITKCIKLNVSILGEITGYNDGEGISCGEPLSYLKANE